jgi:vitamin B12 transporter
VLVDGIRQNDLSGMAAESGLIPVQNVERIEIVKGGASAAWGPAHGGVVNVVTKSPDPDRVAGGLLSSSMGRRATADSRLELSGTGGPVGYYVEGGNISSDGLRPNNGTTFNHAYGKGVWRDPAGGTLTVGASGFDTHLGMDEGTVFGWPVHDDAEQRVDSAFLRYSRPLAARLAFEAGAHALERRYEKKLNDRIDAQNIPFSYERSTQGSRGADLRLAWGDNRNGVVAGAEYFHGRTKSEQLLEPTFIYQERQWDQWAAWVNGTVSLGPVTILPGIRHDETGIAGQYTSVTLGATWQATGGTLLRLYGARGFALPSPTQDDKNLMKVGTLQAGVESTDIPGLWVKGTWFFNRARDIESPAADTFSNQDRKGFEVEARTVPVLGFSLTGAYTYTDAKDADTGERLKTNSDQTVPPHVIKAGLLYDDRDHGLRGTLTGSHVVWNAIPEYNAANRGMVFDLHLNWKVRPAADLSPELFFSGRNLFSNVQTVMPELYSNTPRWFEGGVRWRF